MNDQRKFFTVRKNSNLWQLGSSLFDCKLILCLENNFQNVIRHTTRKRRRSWTKWQIGKLSCDIITYTDLKLMFVLIILIIGISIIKIVIIKKVFRKLSMPLYSGQPVLSLLLDMSVVLDIVNHNILLWSPTFCCSDCLIALESRMGSKLAGIKLYIWPKRRLDPDRTCGVLISVPFWCYAQPT